MKRIVVLVMLIIATGLVAQDHFINVKHNKVLGTLSLLNTAAQGQGSSPTYAALIQSRTAGESTFNHWVEAYKNIDLRTTIKRERFPEKRHSSTSAMDLLWIASANAQDIDDFAIRSIGILPPSEHATFIKALKGVVPYYDTIVWQSTIKERQAIEDAITPFASQIEDIFKKVDTFLGAEWPESTPFNIVLYPIPGIQGATSAIPKGNNLICSYLADNPNQYISVIGIAVHEMNHILYSAQPLSLQKEIDTWFTKSENPFAVLAYDYFDEGMATAVGNGWAFEQITGSLDEGNWYNDTYINGYGKALYPLVKEYIEEGKTIDKEFVNKAIVIFEKTFPDSLTDFNVLMNAVNVFSQQEDEQVVDEYFNTLFKFYRIRSLSFLSPYDDEKTDQYISESNRTKIILIDKERQQGDTLLNKYFPQYSLKKRNTSFFTSFSDEKTKSPILIFYLGNTKDFKPLLEKMAGQDELTFGKVLTLE